MTVLNVRKQLFTDSSFSMQIAADSSQRGKENVHVLRSSWFDTKTNRVHNWIINVCFSVQDGACAEFNAEEIQLTLQDLGIIGHRVKSFISDNAPGAILEGELLRKLLGLPVLWILTCGTLNADNSGAVERSRLLTV
jgi:hypothetical protein